MKNFKYLILIVLLGLTACGDDKITTTNDMILLYRKGEFKKAEVRKTGVYCTTAWYKSIDNFALKRDGTATDGGFEYRWTLAEFGNPLDQKWFDKNCKEVN